LLEENVILGERVHLKTLPVLEVKSDDVKASHGAKIDKLDPQKLFYMTSKGLDKTLSKKLILE
jgi:Fe-S cluster assembly protein SufD